LQRLRDRPDFGQSLEVLLAALYHRIIRSGDIVIDGGANGGLHTIPMARLVRPLGHIVAYEPQPRPLESLQKWIAHERLEKVAILIHHEPVCMSANILKEGQPNPRRDPYHSNQAIPTLLATRDRNRFHNLFPDLRIVQVEWFAFAAYALSGGFKRWNLISENFARRLLQAERPIESAVGRFGAFRMMLVIAKAEAGRSVTDDAAT
jgi:hypothetical protein